MSKIFTLLSSFPPSISILIMGMLIALFAYVIPFQLLQILFVYQACGDTGGTLFCGLFLMSLISFPFQILAFFCLIVLGKVLQASHIKNLFLIFVFSLFFFFFVLPLLGINGLVFLISYKAYLALIIIPAILLFHYLIFGKIQKARFGLRPSLLGFVIWAICAILLIGIRLLINADNTHPIFDKYLLEGWGVFFKKLFLIYSR